MAAITDRNHDVTSIICTTASEIPKSWTAASTELLLKASSRQPKRADGHGDGRRDEKSKSIMEKTNTDIKSH